MADFQHSIVHIAAICAEKGVTDFILSPGSRSAPLTLALVRHANITCRMSVDERSAAFVALGIAQQTRQPVGLVCTSGTAPLNYAPAVAEAFYQKIPLLVLTADRPPEWIDQNDNQTIHQREVYGRHCRAFFELPVEASHPDAQWEVQRILSDAINSTLWPIPGPVHVNVPLREPLYPEAPLTYPQKSRAISLEVPETILSAGSWETLLAEWQSSNRKMIVAGLHPEDPELSAALKTLCHAHDVVLLSDAASNVASDAGVHYHDFILNSDADELRERLRPDLLISFGGPVVSKSLKLFLRHHAPQAHWQLQMQPSCIDTFQSVSRILPVSEHYFFSELERQTASQRSPAHDYVQEWQRVEAEAANLVDNFCGTHDLCSITAMRTVLVHTPVGSHLQLGNSSVVRLASLLGMKQLGHLKVNSNRGTSGIDGTVSTAVGAALATGNTTTLITGDLAFFYDRNGLWNDFVPPNLRIVVFNNGGGGIFRLLDGCKKLPELGAWFETAHCRSARETAQEHGLDYFLCDSMTSLDAALNSFFQPKAQAALLEVKFDNQRDAELYFEFRSLVREIT